MKRFALSVIAHAPLAIRSDHSPTGAETSEFIPGTTLMGSLAAVHRLLFHNEEAAFEKLFLHENISYPHLYPASFSSEELNDANTPVYPIPKTAQSCKRFKGFLPIGDEDKKAGEDEGHGVRDSLLDWAMFKIGSDTGKGDIASLPALETIKQCPHVIAKNANGQDILCHATLDSLNGYYRWSNDKLTGRGKAKVETRLQTHTGINRKSGIVEEHILYNRQVFEEGSCFWGMVTVADEAAQDFEKFITDVRDYDVLYKNDKLEVQGLVRIGTGRTRGLGKVEIDIKLHEEAADEFAAFKQRLDLFDAALRTRAQTSGYENLQPYYFALTLHSPTILHDGLLRYRGTIDGDTLAQQLGMNAQLFDLLYQAASVERVSGWQELWGTPRVNEYALESGSVFLFSSTQAADDSWLRPLFELEQHGLGRRCAEGYGRIAISDPFHREGNLL